MIILPELGLALIDLAVFALQLGVELLYFDEQVLSHRKNVSFTK
jgi:hypothetical protein